MPTLDPDMKKYSWRKYSQNDEDGILDYLFLTIPPRHHYYDEIGISPPASTREDNCRLLYENGWQGLRVDATDYPGYGVVCRKVNPLNINALLREHRVPDDLDLFSLDIDGQDFWVWMALMFRPSVAVIEYNASILPAESRVIPFDPSYSWDGTKWYGASLRSLWSLGMDKGYTLVYANGVNAFFVRNDLVDNKDAFPFEQVYRHRSEHPPDHLSRPWVNIPEK